MAKLARDLKTKLGFTGFDSVPVSGELLRCLVIWKMMFFVCLFFFEEPGPEDDVESAPDIL